MFDVIWLMEQLTMMNMQNAKNSNMVPNAEEQQKYENDIRAQSTGDSPRILSRAGNIAEINIRGILTDKPNFFAAIFGGGNTVYSDIREAFVFAENDPAIDTIILNIDSPGGQATAQWVETMDTIFKGKKNNMALIGTMGSSGAYGIATQAKEIVAINRMTRVGSVGVAAMFFINDRIVDITSTDAPDKKPDPTTIDGMKIIQKELDSIHLVFVNAIARGRNVTVEKVNAEFGRGATMIADEAIKNGMIDAIKNDDNINDKSTIKVEKKPEAVMDVNEFRTKHPVIYSEVFKAGVDQERDRVTGHLIMGEQSGDMETAGVAIRDGSEMTTTIQAKYMTAQMNKTDLENRAETKENLNAADDPNKDTDTDNADVIVAGVEKNLGQG